MSDPSIATADQQTQQQHRELSSGEVVDLHLHGVEVGWHHDGETAFYLPSSDPAERRCVYLRLDGLPADVVTVARRTPVDGEPQPGDVWADDNGALWFAKEQRTGTVVLTPARVLDPADATGRVWGWRDVHDSERGPIRLQYRPKPRMLASDYDDEEGAADLADAAAAAEATL